MLRIVIVNGDVLHVHISVMYIKFNQRSVV